MAARYEYVSVAEIPYGGQNDRKKTVKVRLVARHNKEGGVDKQVDIREFIESPQFTGFTRHGVRMPFDTLKELASILDEVKGIVEGMEKENG